MSRNEGARRRQPATRAVHGPNPAHGPMSTPIVHSTTYSFPSLDAMNEAQDRGQTGAYYQRLGHPTVAACEARLADLEGAERSLLFASGVAALACTFLACLNSGDHVIALEQSYGGTHDLLHWGVEHFGWRCEFVDARAPETWERAFRPETRLLHVESPTNPILAIVDIERAAKLAHARGARLSVDNTFASPVGQQPLAFGADFVVTSATKSIGGHADVLAGLVSGGARALEPVWKVRRIFGPILDPEAAWRIERSLKTLTLRVQAANANALELATRLAAHGAVAQVFYPGLARHPGHEIAKRQMMLGFGPVVSFDMRGGAPAAEAFVNALGLVHHAVSLGGVESLALLPAHTSHIQLGAEGRARAGIPDGLVRLSVGIEDVNDLWADLTQALEAASKAAAGSPARVG